MTTTRFYLDTRRATLGKPSTVKIAIVVNGKQSLLKTDIRILPEYWDEARGKVINHPDKQIINAYLNKLRSQVESILLAMTNEGVMKSMTVTEVKDFIVEALDPEANQRKSDETTFLYRFNKYMEHTSRGTRKTFDYAINRLTAFIGEKALKSLKFEDITVDWLYKFDAFMAKTAAVNSRAIIYRNMRTVFNAAIDDNITSHYPFRRFKIKKEETPNRDLTVEELRVLFFYKCEKHAVKYLDIFKLSFFLHGVNTVDIANLKKDDFSKGRLQFHRTKTNHLYSKLVEPEAQKILEKYKGKDWLVDILDHWENDEYFRRKMNKVMQLIGPVTIDNNGKKHYKPLFPEITSYYARHSWASIASNINIPTEVVAEGLGHEYGNRTTRIYINFDTRRLDAANRQVIDWVLYGKLDGKVVVKPGTPEFFGLNPKEAYNLGLCDVTEVHRGRPKKVSSK